MEIKIKLNVPKEPLGNKAMLGRVAPNLNVSFSSENPSISVFPQPGPSSAAPKIFQTQKLLPSNLEKYVVRYDLL